MAERVVSYRLEAKIDQFTAKMAQASASVRKAANDMTGATKQGREFRAGLTTTGAAAGKMAMVSAAGLGATIKAASDWETAWTGVTKTVDGSAKQMRNLQGELREMARTMPVTHQEIAATAEAAGQLGVKTADISKFTETMLKMGTATDMTADAAAVSIQQMMNVMQTAPEDVDRLSSAVVALGNNGASTESQIVGMAQAISGAAAQVNMSEQDVLGIANAMASIGIEVEAGGSAVSRVLGKMASDTKSGGARLELFAKTAGVSGKEFAKSFEERPAQALVQFIKGLDRAKKSGDNVFGILKSLGMSDIRVQRALLGMAGSGDMLTESLQGSAQAWRENTALTKEYERFAATTGSKTKIAWNNIKDSAIQFGDEALPAVQQAMEGVAKIAETFGDLPQPVKQGTMALGGFVTVAGGSVWAISKMVNGVAGAREAMTQLGIGAEGANRKMMAMRAGAAALSMGAFAVGSMGDKATTSGKALTVFGDAAGGALMGFAVGGPWGAAIGGGIGLLGGLAHAAKQGGDAAREARGEWQAYATTLDQVSGATTAATRAMAWDKLNEAGALKQTRGMGLSDATVVRGVTGDVQARKQLTAAIREQREAIQLNAQAVAEEAREQGANSLQATQAADSYVAAQEKKLRAIEKELGIVDESVRKNRERNAAIADTKRETLANLAAQAKASGSYDQLSKAMKGVPKRVVTAVATKGVPKSRAEAIDLARKYKLTEGERRAFLKAIGFDAAAEAARRVGGAMDAIDGKTVSTYVNNVVTTIRKNLFTPSADGSTVPKTGLGYADRHPYLLADGEEVISNRYGQADRHRALLKAINAGMLADGGTVRGLASGGTARFTRAEYNRAAKNFDLKAGQSAAEAARELRTFSREVKKAGGHVGKNFGALSKRATNVARSLEANSKALDTWRSKQADARAGAASAFNNDAFKGSLADMRVQLEADRNDSNRLASLTANLRGKGAKNDFLASIASSGNLGLVQELASASKSQLLSYQSLYGQRASAQASAGSQAAAGFTPAINAQTNALKALTRRLDKIEGAVERGARRGIRDRNQSASNRSKGK